MIYERFNTNKAQNAQVLGPKFILSIMIENMAACMRFIISLPINILITMNTLFDTLVLTWLKLYYWPYLLITILDTPNTLSKTK